MQVRPVQRADLLAVHRIERASFPQPWPLEAFEQFLDVPGFLVAVDPEGTDEESTVDVEGVVGFVVGDVTASHGRGFGHVKDLAVHPEYRERSVGSTLLEHALVRLGGEGASSVKLEVRVGNDAARSLYEEFGFSKLRRRESYYEDGEDALVLAREL